MLLIITLFTLIWFTAPLIQISGDFPFRSAEKRLYILLAIVLIALLRYLLFGANEKKPKKSAILPSLDITQAIRNRVEGALTFLNKTKINKAELAYELNALPWFLMLGLSDAGKSSLLQKSRVDYILQPQNRAEKNAHCEWWITRDVTLLDIPSNYLTPNESKEMPIEVLCTYLKKQRGKESIAGLIICIPLAEMMMNDSKQNSAYLQKIIQSLHVIQKHFPELPYYLLITKCDLLPGFLEFFADLSIEESNQIWGISLNGSKDSKFLLDNFVNNFNALIKKLNDQMIARLHQERNSHARPLIKDFPLQLEQLKNFLSSLIKKLSQAQTQMNLFGIYLCSANADKPVKTVMDISAKDNQIALEIANPAEQHPFFIKNFLMREVKKLAFSEPTPRKRAKLKRALSLSFSLLAIGLGSYFFIRDFQHGLQKTYNVQNLLTAYQETTSKATSKDQHLIATMNLLNALQPGIMTDNKLTLNLAYLKQFFTLKSNQQTQVIYQQVLQNLLFPEIKNYLEAFMATPDNRSTGEIYDALRAYLMMGDRNHMHVDSFLASVDSILPSDLDLSSRTKLAAHLRQFLTNTWQPLVLDEEIITKNRKYLLALPDLQLSYIILESLRDNLKLSPLINALNADYIFTDVKQFSIPLMYTAVSFPNIISDEVYTAATETSAGSWVLGNENVPPNSDRAMALAEQLRIAYINKYINVWENALNKLQIANPQNLKQLDDWLSTLISEKKSPLLKFLTVIHENTYFDPINSSAKLRKVGALLDEADSGDLHTIMTGLRALHNYLNPVVMSVNPSKAAFEKISSLMQHGDKPPTLTQLRIIADKSPEPIASWVAKIADLAWQILLHEAKSYIDISWEERVMKNYQQSIAHRFPFGPDKHEVKLGLFSQFFGNPGIILDFYHQFLQTFVDESGSVWQWKSLAGNKLFFSNEALRQIQQAMNIHQTFFPNKDNTISIDFALQPYKLGKRIKRVRIGFDNRHFVDDNQHPQAVHELTWPSNTEEKLTSLQLVLANRKIINRDFSGDWGWFKLINQSFETMVNNKIMLVNFSPNETPAKYRLFTSSKFNPLLALNLRHFYLPAKITNEKE